MLKWPPWSREESKGPTDADVRKQIDEKQQELKRRLQDRLGRDIQYEIEAIRRGH